MIGAVVGGIVLVVFGAVLVGVADRDLFLKPVPMIVGYLWMLIGAILIVTGLVGA